MPRIVTNLWFDSEALEAAEYYCSIFPNSAVDRVAHYADARPGSAGTVVTVDFHLDGQPFTAINGNDFARDIIGFDKVKYRVGHVFGCAPTV